MIYCRQFDVRVKGGSAETTDRHQMQIDLPQQCLALLRRQLNHLPIHAFKGLHGGVGIVGVFQHLAIELLDYARRY